MKSKKLILLLATLSLGLGIAAFSACGSSNEGDDSSVSSNPITSSSEDNSSTPITSSSEDRGDSSDSSSSNVTKYSVAINACDGVNVICDEEVEKNGTLQFTVELNKAYEGELTITATVGGVDATVLSGIGGFYSVSGVTGDVVITITGAKLKATSYSVTVNACDGVIVNCGNAVEKNATLQFTAKLDEGYEGELAVTATIDGVDATVSAGENGTYIIESVTGDVVITITGAKAEAKTYKIEFFTEDDGIVMPDTAKVKEGEPFEFEITLQDGYQKKDFWVKANGKDVRYDETKGKYVIDSVTEYLEITAGGAEAVGYTLTFSCEVEGALSVENKTYGYFDDNVVFDIPLTQHYTQSKLVVSYTAGENSGTLTADAEGYYTMPNQKADVTITVSGVTLNNYTVSFLLNGETKHSVSVEALSALTETQLSDAEKAVVANSEYSFVKWAEDVNVEIAQDVAFNAEVIWGETVAENAIRSTAYVTATKDETEEIPAGYTTVYKGAWGDKDGALQAFEKYGFADVNVREYSKIKFAIKGNTHIFNDGWVIAYALTNGWLEISLEKTEGLTWNLTFTQGGNPDTSQTTTVKGETLSAILGNFAAAAISDLDITAYEMYATDIRGVKDPDYSATIADTKLGMVVDGIEPTQDVAAPVGYESVYDAGVISGNWSDASVDNYTKFRFKIMTNGWQLYEGWGGKYEPSKLYAWLEVSAEKTDDGWTVKIKDVDDVRYEKTLNGSSLKSIFKAYATQSVNNELVAHTYVTELRGEKAPVWEGVLLTGAGIEGFAESTDKIVPEGFEKAYYKEGVAEGTKFTETDISAYKEVRFYVALPSGYININGWGAYAENAGFGTDWHLVSLVNDGENNWTITVNAKLSGGNVTDKTKYTYTASGSTLKAVLNNWFSFVGGEPNVYVTEIRGVKADA